MANDTIAIEIAGHASRAVRFVTDLITNIERRNLSRRTSTMLGRLSDSQLDDIGVHRGDVLGRG